MALPKLNVTLRDGRKISLPADHVNVTESGALKVETTVEGEDELGIVAIFADGIWAYYIHEDVDCFTSPEEN